MTADPSPKTQTFNMKQSLQGFQFKVKAPAVDTDQDWFDHNSHDAPWELQASFCSSLHIHIMCAF